MATSTTFDDVIAAIERLYSIVICGTPADRTTADMGIYTAVRHMEGRALLRRHKARGVAFTVAVHRDGAHRLVFGRKVDARKFAEFVLPAAEAVRVARRLGVENAA